MADSPQPRLRLGRSMRLKKGRDFARFKREGRRMVCGLFIANWQTLPPGSATRLGVITSKAIGNAVVRVRARRLLRETFRRHQHDFAQSVDFVLVAQKQIVGKKLPDVEAVFVTMLQKARLLKTE
jgi:ribonuclease P protein component